MPKLCPVPQTKGTGLEKYAVKGERVIPTPASWKVYLTCWMSPVARSCPYRDVTLDQLFPTTLIALVSLSQRLTAKTRALAACFLLLLALGMVPTPP